MLYGIPDTREIKEHIDKLNPFFNIENAVYTWNDLRQLSDMDNKWFNLTLGYMGQLGCFREIEVTRNMPQYETTFHNTFFIFPVKQEQITKIDLSKIVYSELEDILEQEVKDKLSDEFIQFQSFAEKVALGEPPMEIMNPLCNIISKLTRQGEIQLYSKKPDYAYFFEVMMLGLQAHTYLKLRNPGESMLHEDSILRKYWHNRK